LIRQTTVARIPAFVEAAIAVLAPSHALDAWRWCVAPAAAAVAARMRKTARAVTRAVANARGLRRSGRDWRRGMGVTFLDLGTEAGVDEP
jgi:hypothetical protein